MLFILKGFPLEKAAVGSGHHVCIATAKGVPVTQLPESLRERAGWGMTGMALEEVARMRPEDETKERGSVVYRSWPEDQLLNVQEFCRSADFTSAA